MSNLISEPSSVKNPQHFSYNGSNVDIRLDSQGDLWFKGADACRSVGIGNPSDVYTRLDDDEKMTLAEIEGHPRQSVTSPVYVSESGLYNLILRSDKPEAKAFKKWITSEVLPAIRKTGTYSVIQRSPAKLLLQAVQQLVDHEERLDEHDTRIGAIEARQSAIDEWTEHFTIVAYCNLNRLRSLPVEEAREVGKRASTLSKQRGAKVGKTLHPTYGTVNTYHKDILREVLQG